MAKKRKRNLYKGTQLRQRQDKDNTEYWRDRAIEREAFWNDKSRSTIEKELAAQYRQAAQAIQNNIAALYGRFATENGLTMKEARALLKGNEFKEWRYDLERYTQLASGDDAILRELNTLAMRPRISRLEKLYSETLKELHSLGEKSSSSMKAFLEDAYKDNYYRGLFDIGQTAGIKGTISMLNGEAVERVVKNPWSGKNYSDRIWKNQKQLAATIQKTVTDGVHRGLSVPKLSKMVQERMNVGQYEATRLVRTELNYVHNQANLKSIEDSGLGFYEYVATLDKRTSNICRARDGQIIPIEEASPGNNLPPLHPHCRSTIIGSLGQGKGGKSGTRIARDDKGNSFYVPKQMTYNDYKSVYITRSNTIAEWAKKAGYEGDLAMFTPKNTSKVPANGGIIEPKEHSEAYNNVMTRIHALNVEELPVSELPKQLNGQQIIERLAGGDNTRGSCSSLAFAYIGNRHGLDVLDFRGGNSQMVFSRNDIIRQMAKLPNVKADIFSVKAECKETAKYLLSDKIKFDKEYYLATGQHAAIIRKTDTGLEFLELQSPVRSGWRSFDEYGSLSDTLKRRFGCRVTPRKLRSTNMVLERDVVVIDVDSMADNEEFKEILGYINTKKDKQLKGVKGNEK